MDPLVAISLRRNTGPSCISALPQKLVGEDHAANTKINSEELQAEKAYSQNSHWIPSQPP